MSHALHVPLPGTTLIGEAAGSGDPVVLLHGLAGDRSVWDGLWDVLLHDRQVVRYDLRGFGESVADPSVSFSHTRDLATLLDAAGIDRCDLVGVSLGGSVALNFALDRPARTRRLVLISPGLTGWDWSDEWRLRWRDIVTAARAGDIAAAKAEWWAHPLFDSVRDTPQATSLRAVLDRYSGAVWAESSMEDPALPDLDRLPTLRAPALLLTGSTDVPDFRLIATMIETAAPHVTRHDFAGAGHMVHLERPAEVAQAIGSFLAGTP